MPSLLVNFLAPLRTSPVVYRIARGAFWSIVGAVLSRGLQLVAFMIAARVLGKIAFGELGIIQNTVGVFSVFAGVGLGLTATKHLAGLRNSDPARAGRLISMSGVIAVGSGATISILLYIIAPWLASFTLKAAHLTPLLRLSAPMLLFGATYGAQTGALAGFEAFKSIAFVNLISGFVGFPLQVAGVYLFGLKGSIAALICGLGISCLLNHFALMKQAEIAGVPIVFGFFRKELPVIWKFSLPAMFSSAIVGPINWICSVILVNSPNGYAEMGIFNAASQWRMAVLFLPITIGAIVLPILSSLLADNDQKSYRRVLRMNIILNAAVSLLIVIPVIALARQIMNAYGKTFIEGWPVLVLLCIGAILMSINNVIGQAIASQGKMWTGFLFNAIWAISTMVFAVVLIPKSGAAGLAWGFLLGYLIHSLGQSFYLVRLCSTPTFRDTSER